MMKHESIWELVPFETIISLIEKCDCDALIIDARLEAGVYGIKKVQSIDGEWTNVLVTAPDHEDVFRLAFDTRDRQLHGEDEREEVARDGGPAYPTTYDEMGYSPGLPGLSLLEHYAADAMPKITFCSHDEPDLEDFAKGAFDLAEAMVAEALKRRKCR